jgi:hypothetical protein
LGASQYSCQRDPIGFENGKGYGHLNLPLQPKFQFCTFWSATIHRRFGIFRLGANYSLSNVSCGDAEKVLRTGEQSGDKSPQSKKNAKLELSSLRSLMERGVRRSLKGKPMYGIYPENRPSRAPAGRGILECFEELSIVITKHKGETRRRLEDLSPVQRQLVKMMGIPPDSLTAF